MSSPHILAHHSRADCPHIFKNIRFPKNPEEIFDGLLLMLVSSFECECGCMCWCVCFQKYMHSFTPVLFPFGIRCVKVCMFVSLLGPGLLLIHCSFRATLSHPTNPPVHPHLRSWLVPFSFAVQSFLVHSETPLRELRSRVTQPRRELDQPQGLDGVQTCS